MRILNLTKINSQQSAVKGLSVKNRRRSASSGARIVFSSEGTPRLEIRCLSTGSYSGNRGNYVSAVLRRLSSNRYAVQLFTRNGSQINGNVIDTGGISGVVTDFNADKDLYHDFRAVFLSEVDAAFSDGTGFANSTPLTGGRG